MRLLELREELRAEIAALVGVPAAQVALTASTTDGCNIVLAGLALGPGDEVVTTTDEHFGLLGPLHTSGAKVVVAEPDPERIVAAVTPRTRLVALSHVLWTTGAVLPVHELRAATGVPILVDGAQSVGAISVDAAGLDFYTVSGQKWLCGPEGTGALVVADPDALRVGHPSYLSQDGYEQDGTFEPREGAARFDPNLTPGSRTLQACRPRSARFPGGHTSVRARWPSASAAGLTRRLAATWSCRTIARRSSRGALPWTSRRRSLRDSPTTGVIVRDLPGRGLVRASVGWWTNDDDLERLVAAL